MSLITYNGLVELVERGVIENTSPELINGASIDVRLGDTIWVENIRGGKVDLANKETPSLAPRSLREAPFPLRPGEFVLAQTLEVFNLPDDIAFEFKLKSSSARAGLNHSLAGFADPGWHDSVLTLELQNVLAHHQLLLSYGMKIGQIVFYRGEMVPHDRSYATRGQYNKDRGATPSRGLR